MRLFELDPKQWPDPMYAEDQKQATVEGQYM